ncbi:hypothetical protein ACTQ4E_10230 [Lawsonibacter sp. LCP25S3_G6]
MPELLLRLSETEGLVDFVALTFVANQRTDKMSDRIIRELMGLG